MYVSLKILTLFFITLCRARKNIMKFIKFAGFKPNYMRIKQKRKKEQKKTKKRENKTMKNSNISCMFNNFL